MLPLPARKPPQPGRWQPTIHRLYDFNLWDCLIDFVWDRNVYVGNPKWFGAETSYYQTGILAFNWFRCYHTRCDNRHRILPRWFQFNNFFFFFFFFFLLANQTHLYINFEYRKINNHCFSSKSIFHFFLPFENNIIKSISYEIIQNNQ